MSTPLILASRSWNFPLLNVFWTMLIFFLWVLWLFLLFRVILDIFRSSDMSGWAKTGWVVFVIILPYLGVLTYLIVRGTGMHSRDVQGAQQADAAMRSYIQQTAGTSQADELTKLAALRDQGVLTEAEFNAQKAKLLV
jgi:hypothetical protein